ncbi:MAG TPA: hypothetical protein VEW07_13345 [Solirubrobacterales bacterium]|nr:hypothetical protein [Solirubrobacterales bacterium]
MPRSREELVEALSELKRREENRAGLLGNSTATMLTEARDLLDSLEELERTKLALDEARYSPMGDNHHNAAACPHCRPELEGEQAKLRAEHERANRAEDALRKIRSLYETACREEDPEDPESEWDEDDPEGHAATFSCFQRAALLAKAVLDTSIGDREPETCGRCGGSGRAQVPGFDNGTVNCPSCNGTGTKPPAPCSDGASTQGGDASARQPSGERSDGSFSTRVTGGEPEPDGGLASDDFECCGGDGEHEPFCDCRPPVRPPVVDQIIDRLEELRDEEKLELERRKAEIDPLSMDPSALIFKAKARAYEDAMHLVGDLDALSRLAPEPSSSDQEGEGRFFCGKCGRYSPTSEHAGCRYLAAPTQPAVLVPSECHVVGCRLPEGHTGPCCRRPLSAPETTDQSKGEAR